jgi:C4-dicarboxylate-specific signal transduction histidine kinase
MKLARESDGSTQEARLLEVINRGASELTERYLNSLHGQADAGNVNAITWLLTHNPLTREHWSDAAAERRTERKTVGTVLEAVAAAGLPADLERNLLLQMQARGLGAAVQEGDG